MNDIVFLTKDQARALLPAGETVHTFRGSRIPVGVDLSRQKILEAIETYQFELTGPGDTAMGHGMGFRDAKGLVFVATDPTRLAELTAALDKSATGTPTPPNPSEILAESGVGYPNYNPFVNLRFGDHVAQLTVAAARELALHLFEVAEAAESDAFIVRFMQERVGVANPEQIATVLSDFRAFRG